MSTTPVATIALVKSPSILSVATAPGSLKVSPTNKFIGLAPFKVITGGTVSGPPRSPIMTTASI